MPNPNEIAIYFRYIVNPAESTMFFRRSRQSHNKYLLFQLTRYIFYISEPGIRSTARSSKPSTEWDDSALVSQATTAGPYSLLLSSFFFEAM